MTINFRKLIFVFLFLCLANALFGQQNERLLKHRITWTKDEYALRYEVIIEKEVNKKYSTVFREFTEEPFIDFLLPSGDYRIRIIPYDFRNVPGKGTEWKNFKIISVTNAGESQLAIEWPTPLPPEQEETKKPAEEIADNTTEDADLTKPEKQKDLYVGLLAETSGYSRYNTAFGGGIVFGGNFDGIGMGLNLLYAWDAESFIFFETLAHVRLYFSREKDNTGIFLQAEGGVVFFSYENFEITDYSALSVGLRAGWRFIMIDNWYVEPFIRGGYPYIFGLGFSSGFKFDLKSKK